MAHEEPYCQLAVFGRSAAGIAAGPGCPGSAASWMDFARRVISLLVCSLDLKRFDGGVKEKVLSRRRVAGHALYDARGGKKFYRISSGERPSPGQILSMPMPARIAIHTPVTIQIAHSGEDTSARPRAPAPVATIMPLRR